MKQILIATLGDSPVVVTSMFDLLTAQESLPIDSVALLHTRGERRTGGFSMIDDALTGRCTVESYELAFEDADTEETCFAFLQQLFALLKIHQEQQDQVYLSLAGGRKNMSALMALAAPFYTCVKVLYHVIDKSEATDKANFKSYQELIKLHQEFTTLQQAGEQTDKTRFMRIMHPKLDDLYLVPIPLENTLRVPDTYLDKLHIMTAEQLQKLWEQDPSEAERIQFSLKIINPRFAAPLLRVYLTQKAKDEYKHFVEKEANLGDRFTASLKSMRSGPLLYDNKHPQPFADPKKKKPYPCYVYKPGSTKDRPFFHTEPDIMRYSKEDFETGKADVTVIVERLALHRSSEKEYEPSVEQLLSTKYTKEEKLYLLENILQEMSKTIQSVLIVPLGTQPMVATQLYTLLKERARRDIRKVLLLYPGSANEVYKSVKIATCAFRYEKVECEARAVPGLEDVRSRSDCEIYQKTLEEIIISEQKEILLKHPDRVIDLALSGGRKGMAALALFAAQRTQLHAVYHTLIANEELERRIVFEVEASNFDGLSQRKKNDKLFLRDYKAYAADFRLFTVPIGPWHGSKPERG